MFLTIGNWLCRRGARNVFNWGEAIGAKVRQVHQIDPIDVLEMEESFGWCADVQKHFSNPVIVRLHGPEFLTQISALANEQIAAERIEKETEALRKIATIVSPSKSTLLETISRYDLHPAIQRVVPNPVIVDPALQLWNSDACDRKMILFVGQFSKVKGGDIVLIAFRKLLDLDNALKLVFVGPDVGLASTDGSSTYFNEFRDSLFAEAQRLRINYLGQVPRSEVFDLEESPR